MADVTFRDFAGAVMKGGDGFGLDGATRTSAIVALRQRYPVPG